MAAASFSSLFFMLLFHLPIYSAEEVSSYDEACPPSSCGDVEIKLPFSQNQGCGFYAIECTEPESIPKIQFEKEGRQYVVKNISYTNNELTIQDDQFSLPLLPTNCGFLNNSIVPLFNFTLTSPELTFFKCMKNFNPPESFRNFQNYTLCREENIYYTDVEDTPPLENPPPGCSIVQYPVPRGSLPRHGQDWSNDDFLALFSAGFSLNWENFPDCFPCQQRGGRCDLNQATQSFRCNDSRKPNVKRKVIVGVCAGIGSFLTACLLAFLFYRPRHNRLTTLRSLSADSSLGPDLEIDVKPREHLQTLPNVEAFLNEYGSFAPKRYKYSAVKKMTKSFRHKLGQGGYGDVFKGKLPDSRSVAVKILTKSKGNGEDFINEVASIGRTSHVNIVTLLGFCSEGPKRALIYEFMPNGSLEKFIYSDRPRTTHPLGWEKLYQIAIGIARGLEYLHCWCNTRILHFDIKPHNILLDKDFCPKISDFGLAKLCPSRESSVSMLDARGTVGYTAPELFCRNIGRVSNKSDVYSYGMMVLEMVGGRKNIDPKVENISEIYFPHWIYNRLDLHENLELCGVTTGSEEEIARKMIVVALWCIQTDPMTRPSMTRVVEMLEGSLEGLLMPPKPYLSSPSRS